MLIKIHHKPASSDQETIKGLSALVTHHLRAYFEAHHDHLPPDGLYHRVLEEVERALFQETLRAVDGNQIKAAEILGIHRNTLRRKMSR